MTDPDQLPPELADLFSAERAARTADPSLRSSIRSRLATVLVGVPLGTAAAAGTLGGISKLVTVVAITVAAGGGTVGLVHYGRSGSDAPPARAPVRQASSIPTPHVEAAPALGPAVAAAPIVEVPPALPAPIAIKHAQPRPSEPELVRDAWTALSDHDAPRALQIVARATQLYPAGLLDEEREAVHIVALAKLRRLDAAQAAAARFTQLHPTSVHRALVERALHDQDSL